MAKASVALVASAIVFLAITGSTHCHDEPVKVKGSVYCDQCHTPSPTWLSKYVAGAEVDLVCRNKYGKETLRMTTKTTATGEFLFVTTEHKDDNCTVTAISTPDVNCSHRAPEINIKGVRVAYNPAWEIPDVIAISPIGFWVEKPNPRCAKVIENMKNRQIIS